MSQLIDLSHTFTEKMPVWPGDIEPEFIQKATVERDGYSGAVVKASLHVGTHIDAPSHMIPGGKNLSEIPLERFFGDGILIDARGKREIDSPLLNDKARGKIVLVLTGWSQKFGGDGYFEDFPQMTESFAKKLVKLNVKLIGIDTPSPDLEPYPIHKILLAHEILIAENLTNLEALVETNHFEVSAFPAKMAADGAPVRVVAKI